MFNSLAPLGIREEHYFPMHNMDHPPTPLSMIVVVRYGHNSSEAEVKRLKMPQTWPGRKENLYRYRELTVAIWVSGLDKYSLHSEAVDRESHRPSE